ncbi:PHP domain protein [bacterium BMS3Abin07]|nr:PHP domain protein [bacterium BMS3Abin07]GBE32481.1 PHP domain protein [bacterium BMS3Bbin05]HDO21668.1 PHP domain-containing protein [Nitrospirota bacterium]HDZ88513.1 PHP domain-containing protein [Nitrospirota bacterium]
MIKRYRSDLHIHSCLSPCAELDMTPKRIISRAVEKQLDIIAVSDHNSAEHVHVTMELGSKHNIAVLPAMEISSAEEVHMLAFFDSIDDCLKVHEDVSASMSNIPSYSHDETSQPVVNVKEEILYFNPLPLINAADIPVEKLVGIIHRNNGLAVASHIDREVFGIISQLGFIPEGLPLDAVEVSWRVKSEEEAQRFIAGQEYPIVSFSDAHHIVDIGRRITEFYIEKPAIKGIRMCLRSEAGRKLTVLY